MTPEEQSLINDYITDNNLTGRETEIAADAFLSGMTAGIRFMCGRLSGDELPKEARERLW